MDPGEPHVGGPPELLTRLEALAPLLAAISGALDIRHVFNRVSEVTRAVLPHDAMGLALLEADGVHARLYAVSSDVDFERPDVVRISEGEHRLLSGPAAFEVADDISTDPVWQARPPGRVGLRSMLRVPIQSGGAMAGGLSFFSRAVGAFSEADVPVARRVAEYVTLALSHQQLAEEAARAAEARERAQRLERRVEALTRELASFPSTEHRVIGQSLAWRHAITEASRVAPTETTVLLVGESGTGKELVARLIHRESPRAKGPFAAINCAALPEPLLESELFGAERGAFTGAVQSRAGRLEQAAGGTLFLDEVAEMSPSVQSKLLRVLQEREFQRLGGSRTLHADVRVIAATNRDLRRLVEQGRFRDDLFYRLDVFGIRLPPLRERPDDILRLTAAFLDDAGRALGRPVSGLSADARPALLAYRWPGNVRELRNVIERASILADGGLVTRAHLNLPGGTFGAEPAADFAPVHGEVTDVRGASRLPGAASGAAWPRAAVPPAGPLDEGFGTPEFPEPRMRRDSIPPMARVERELLTQALEACRFNKAATARALGLTRAQLYHRLRKHRLPK